jgi:hypothetical protein
VAIGRSIQLPTSYNRAFKLAGTLKQQPAPTPPPDELFAGPWAIGQLIVVE